MSPKRLTKKKTSMKRFHGAQVRLILVVLGILTALPSPASAQVACIDAFEPAPTQLYKQAWRDRVTPNAPPDRSLYKTIGLLLMGETDAIRAYREEGRASAEYARRAQELEFVRESVLTELESEQPSDPRIAQLLSDTIFKVAISRSAGEIRLVQNFYRNLSRSDAPPRN